MGLFRGIYLKLSSENKLRKKADKMYQKLEKVDYYGTEGTKYRGLSNKYNDYVNAINSKGVSKLPKREHGWYVSKDD